MAQVRGVLLEAYEHADFSVLALVEKLRRPRDASRFPLFSNTFNMEPLAVPPMFGLEVEWVSPPVGHSKFDCEPERDGARRATANSTATSTQTSSTPRRSRARSATSARCSKTRPATPRGGCRN